MSKSIRKNAKQIRKNAKSVESPESLPWSDLELVLSLSRAGTLSGAALSLGVNTSTIARRLDALEQRCGAHLFDRTPAGVGATELALELVPLAETMEQVVADALRLIAGRETEIEGSVRLTAPPGVANWFVAPALARLGQRYPRLRIELDAEVGYADLTRRQADLALRGVRPSSGDLIAVKLGEPASLIVAAPALVAELELLRELDELPWITWGADLAHLPEARWLADHVDADRIVLRTSSMDAQIHAARAGLGAMLISRPFLDWVELAAVPLSRGLSRRLDAMPSGALWLVGHRALRDVPRVEAVWTFLLEEAAAVSW